VWARVAKAYAAFAPSPLARWYAREMHGGAFIFLKPKNSFPTPRS